MLEFAKMSFSDKVTNDMLKPLFDKPWSGVGDASGIAGRAPSSTPMMSLHTGPPGDTLENEVSYDGYTRQPFGGQQVEFPYCVAGGDCWVTHAAVSQAGVVLFSFELSSKLRIDPGTSASIDAAILLDELADAPPETAPAMLSSRFAAVAAELAYEDED